MLGYVRNARISAANANAKLVHTSVATALTQMSIAGKSLAGSKTEVPINIGPGVSNDEIKVDNAAGGFDWDMISYLGDNFTGAGYAVCIKETYSVKYALWQQGDAAITEKGQLDESGQKEKAKAGTIIGCYPLASGDSSSTGGSSGGDSDGE